MSKKELLEELKVELNEADGKLVGFRNQMIDIQNDIEYWDRQTKSLRTVLGRLAIEAHKEEK